MVPKRIQRKRTAGWRMPENTTYVGRPSKWGNPYRLGGRGFDGRPLPTVERVVEAYRRWAGMYLAVDAVRELAGRNLACWCKLTSPCHADVLLELANGAAR